ncbi:MAG: hypothetical protein K2X08_00690 [Chlamydiales bacterium]|nr:hypothetical protein [Chlamydiales bacterium]
MSTYNRTHPYIARIKDRYLLTKGGSSKETYHIELDLPCGELPFQVGDSLAVLPENNLQLIEQILQLTSYSGDESVLDPKLKTPLSLQTFLQKKANLSKVHPRFLSLLHKNGTSLNHLLEEKQALQDFLASNNILSLLRQMPKGVYSAQEFVDHLMPLTPRFYSIASSPTVFPNEVHLTVSFVSYMCGGEKQYGVASFFLCQQATIESTPIAVYVQPSNHFSLPAPDASIILVGPGTGVAPFRAFLQERLAREAKGRNWLFFGERHGATDFYYESFFTELAKQNHLRLDTAFSRDQEEKIYVQNKLCEHSASIWDWLQDGAFFYVCGNADKMAKDVDAALQHIAATQGNLSQEDARLYLKKLKAEKRYLLDVY